MPEISVIIANWNGKRFLEECLSALRRQTFRDFETILVDNGSNDGSAEFVCAHFPEVSLLALSTNRGFTGGNIAGYETANGRLVALLNNDTEAHPFWLQAIHNGASSHPEAGSFASKMVYYDDRRKIENCGFEVDVAGMTVEVGRDQIDGPQWQHSRKVFGACGGAVAYRRAMLEQVGFLDPDFFMIYEDVDLSFRAQLSGYDCVYLPQAIVYHRYRSTIAKQPALQVFYAQRNIEFLYLKNMPLSLILRSAPRRLLYEIGAALYFLWNGNGSAFLRAKLHVLRHLGSILRKRRAIQRRKVLASSGLRLIMCGPGLSSKWNKFVSARRISRGVFGGSAPETGGNS
jgi:hypothetical protein